MAACALPSLPFRCKRFYKNGKEVHQHSGISEEKLVGYLEEFLGE